MGGLPTTQPIVAFAADPTTSPVMFAALSDGVWKSLDGGKTWQQLTHVPKGITTLTVHPEKREIVFAGTDNGRIFRSADGGALWQPSQ